MSQIAKLYVVRHGQTSWNKEKRIQGSTDIELNEEGLTQAKVLSEVFSSLPIKAVYSSTMIRAKQTAEIIAKPFNHTVIENLHIHEKNMGQIEGKKIPDYHKEFEKELQQYYQLNFYERLFSKIVADAESMIDVAERVLPALHEICQNHKGQEVVVVSHGHVLKLLMILVGKFQEETIHIDNGAILEMEGNGKEIFLINAQGVVGEKSTLFSQ